MRAVDRQNIYHLYVIMMPDYHYNINEYFGHETCKEVVSKTIYKFEDFNASNLISFSCGSHMTMLVNKAVPKVISIIPDRETESGVTHAYKADGQWKFIPQEEFAARKGELPGLSFAIQYPFASFEQKALALPDLNDVLTKIGVDEEGATHGDISSSASKQSIPKEEAVYVSVTKINGKEQRVYLREDEVTQQDS